MPERPLPGPLGPHRGAAADRARGARRAGRRGLHGDLRRRAIDELLRAPRGSASASSTLFNRTVEPRASAAAGSRTHLCFGNFKGRAVGAAQLRAAVPGVPRLARRRDPRRDGQPRVRRARGRSARIAERKDVAVGIIDVKSYYIETPEDVAAARPPLPARSRRPSGSPSRPTAASARPRAGRRSTSSRTWSRASAGARGARAAVIVPVQKDDALLADVGAADARDGTCASGGSARAASSSQFDGRHLLLDPVPVRFAHREVREHRQAARAHDRARRSIPRGSTSSTSSPRATTTPTISTPRRWDRCATPIPAWRWSSPRRTAPSWRAPADRHRQVPVGLAVGQHVDVGPFRIEAVPAAHEALESAVRRLRRPLRRAGRCTTRATPCRYEGMADALRPHAVDVALLPINGGAGASRRRATSTPARRPRSPTTSARVWPSPATTRCSRSTRQTPRRSSRPAVPIGQRAVVLHCGEQWSSSAI